MNITIAQLQAYLERFDPACLVITTLDDPPAGVDWIDLDAAVVALRDGQESGPS